MTKNRRKGASPMWNTTMMLDYAIEYYGLQAHNDPFTGKSARDAWMRTIQRRLRDMEKNTKHGGRKHCLSERDAKRFIESDMLLYFEGEATKDDAVQDAHRLIEAQAEDDNYAEIMAARAEANDEWARETEGMVFPPLDTDEMLHIEIRSMLQVVIHVMTDGKQQFDIETFEADYRELNDLSYLDHYDLEPPNRVRKMRLADRLADPIGSYLKPIASNGD